RRGLPTLTRRHIDSPATSRWSTPVQDGRWMACWTTCVIDCPFMAAAPTRSASCGRHILDAQWVTLIKPIASGVGHGGRGGGATPSSVCAQGVDVLDSAGGCSPGSENRGGSRPAHCPGAGGCVNGSAPRTPGRVGYPRA